MNSTPTPKSLQPSHTFIGGSEHAGSIGHYLDNAKNPYDLRPAVDLILKAAKEADADVILIGEPHHMPSRVALTQALTAKLIHENLRPQLALELPHNFWSSLATNMMQRQIPEELRYTPSEFDPSGKAMLSALLQHRGLGSATRAFHSLMAFCYENDIPAFCSDVVNTPDLKLDLNDPITAKAARLHLPDQDIQKLNLSRDNPELMPTCMGISNTTMATIASNRKARTIIQPVGLNHIFGNAHYDCSYTDSLTSAYERADLKVLPVFLTIEEMDMGLNILPKGASKALRTSVVIDGLAEDGFMYGENDEEKTLILKLRTESGGELDFYDVMADKDKYTQRANEEADALLERYRNSIGDGPA
jgi:hypothetical protein